MLLQPLTNQFPPITYLPITMWVTFLYSHSLYIRGGLKIKNTIICGKSPKGGGGQRQNQKSLNFKCRLTLTEGGSEFFRFFPNSNNWNMTLIFMIYGTDIGEIYATYGIYEWNSQYISNLLEIMVLVVSKFLCDIT